MSTKTKGYKVLVQKYVQRIKDLEDEVDKIKTERNIEKMALERSLDASEKACANALLEASNLHSNLETAQPEIQRRSLVDAKMKEVQERLLELEFVNAKFTKQARVLEEKVGEKEVQVANLSHRVAELEKELGDGDTRVALAKRLQERQKELYEANARANRLELRLKTYEKAETVFKTNAQKRLDAKIEAETDPGTSEGVSGALGGTSTLEA